TYPFVTSSNTVAGNACTGSGFGPAHIDGVIGILKAYTTRVGEGPFPSELFDATGDELQKKGGEFGATTGRKRRCGWLDAVVANEAVRLNGVTGFAITKLDVLSGQPTLKIATAYEEGGERLTAMPGNIRRTERLKPLYEEIPGWSEEIRHAKCLDDLPTKARDYVKRIEELTETPAMILSVGPGREETLLLRNPFEK
ncbi:MAG: adenylosuccinate synthetase, partial [Desulfobulbaceae bacterium]|nr:adenylosuccinate synthetase [Desulfobulbaceae bacterium]